MTKHWSDGHIPQIAQWLNDGLTAAQIAQKFTGVTRNAVIGLVSRRKELVSIGFVRSKSVSKDIGKKIDRIREIRSQAIKKDASPQPVLDEVVIRPDIASSLYDADSLRVELHNIPDGGCKWPVNNVPAGGLFLFCGHEAMPDKPYCEHHYKRSISKGTPSEQSAIRSALRAA